MRAVGLNRGDWEMLGFDNKSGALVGRIPGSDAAGDIVAVGKGVKGFRPGTRVTSLYFRNWTDGTASKEVLNAAHGIDVDGVLGEYVVLQETAVVAAPKSLTYEEAATLPTAGLTAWNATVGKNELRDRIVLVQGTGGVSIFALQFAKMHGATVIVTSSSDEKLARAKKLGANHTINYKTTPDWDKKVLELTDGQGAEHVIDTGGVGTLPKSYVAVGPGGVVSIIGVMTRPEGDQSPYPLMFKGAMARGIFVGGREHFEALMKAVAVNELKPVIDKTFDFDAAPEAFKYLKSAQHFGKVVIKI